MTLLIDLGNKPLAFAPALRSLLAGAAGGVIAIGLTASLGPTLRCIRMRPV